MYIPPDDCSTDYEPSFSKTNVATNKTMQLIGIEIYVLRVHVPLVLVPRIFSKTFYCEFVCRMFFACENCS